MSRERFTASPRHRMSVSEKFDHDRCYRPTALWQCRLCGVKVLGRDQAGHTSREHPGVSHGWDLVTG